MPSAPTYGLYTRMFPVGPGIIREAKNIVDACVIKLCKRDQDMRRNVAVPAFIAVILRLAHSKICAHIFLCQVMVDAQIIL